MFVISDKSEVRTVEKRTFLDMFTFEERNDSRLVSLFVSCYTDKDFYLHSRSCLWEGLKVIRSHHFLCLNLRLLAPHLSSRLPMIDPLKHTESTE